MAEIWIRNIGQLITLETSLGEGPLGLIENGAIAMAEGKILWVGPDDALEKACQLAPDGDEINAGGRVVIPGLVDCHTHTIFAGSRAHEYELRARGASYQEIAAAGGGIASTMAHTRAIDFDTLMDLTLKRLTRFLSQGVTTVEIKSGYGLDWPTEKKILSVAQMVEFSHPIGVVPTFLGAHVVPPEHKANPTAYVDQVVDEMLPAVAEGQLAAFCDVFCEEGAFSLEESRRILERAKSLGLEIRLHADQLSASGGSALAAELGAASADHLEYTEEADLKAMAQAGTVAVLLPGAAFFLGQELPDARRFLDAGCDVALATDFNPGSSPTQNLLLMGTMAVSRMGMLPHEALIAMTRGGAKALKLESEIGSLLPGKQADLALFDVEDYRSLFYHFGESACALVIKEGQSVYP